MLAILSPFLLLVLFFGLPTSVLATPVTHPQPLYGGTPMIVQNTFLKTEQSPLNLTQRGLPAYRARAMCSISNWAAPGRTKNSVISHDTVMSFQFTASGWRTPPPSDTASKLKFKEQLDTYRRGTHDDCTIDMLDLLFTFRYTNLKTETQLGQKPWDWRVSGGFKWFDRDGLGTYADAGECLANTLLGLMKVTEGDIVSEGLIVDKDCNQISPITCVV